MVTMIGIGVSHTGGTKWDVDVNNASYDGNELHISFSSAWSPPVEALQYAANKHGFTFEHSYYEGGMMFVGYATEDADDCYSYTYDKHPSEEVPEFLTGRVPLDTARLRRVVRRKGVRRCRNQKDIWVKQ
jgi:hypothetical protein